MYALELTGRLTFATAGTVLGGLLLRMGHAISLAATGTGQVTAVAVREGGSGFLESCQRLTAEPLVVITDNMRAAPRSPISCKGSPTGSGGMDLSEESHLEVPSASEVQLPEHNGLEIAPAPPRLTGASALEE